jgi:hypothetical protein
MVYQENKIRQGGKSSTTASALRSVAMGLLLTLSVNGMAQAGILGFAMRHKLLTTAVLATAATVHCKRVAKAAREQPGSLAAQNSMCPNIERGDTQRSLSGPSAQRDINPFKG